MMLLIAMMLTFVPINPSYLSIMSGHLQRISATRFSVNDNIRASYDDINGNAAELSFIYLGYAPKLVPLTSGEIRRQLGLKLRAQDTCNVVYVMWHIEPTSGIYVA